MHLVPCKLKISKKNNMMTPNLYILFFMGLILLSLLCVQLVFQVPRPNTSRHGINIMPVEPSWLSTGQAWTVLTAATLTLGDNQGALGIMGYYTAILEIGGEREKMLFAAIKWKFCK